jgi:hypothetical protein
MILRKVVKQSLPEMILCIALKQQFYPLAYMQQEMMNWECLRQSKGQSVQEYTQICRKKA